MTPFTLIRPATGVRQRAYVPSLIAIGLVVSVISSLGAPLIPTIAHDLHASLSATQWSLTATLLVGAVASPLVGRLGDGPHRRTVLVVCLGLVTLGGAIAAVAGTLPELVAGRAFQGLGLALMPLTMASARDHLEPRRAGETIAVLSVIAAVGVGLGYPITGFIAEHFDASAAFWFGTAASGTALILAALFVPAPATPAHHRARLARRRADRRGRARAAARPGEGRRLGLGRRAPRSACWRWRCCCSRPGRATSCGCPSRSSSCASLRRRAVLTANVTGLVLGMAMYLGISLMTQVVQQPTGLDESIFVAGLTLLPLSALSTLSSRLVPTVRRYVGAARDDPDRRAC